MIMIVRMTEMPSVRNFECWVLGGNERSFWLKESRWLRRWKEVFWKGKACDACSVNGIQIVESKSHRFSSSSSSSNCCLGFRGFWFVETETTLNRIRFDTLLPERDVVRHARVKGTVWSTICVMPSQNKNKKTLYTCICTNKKILHVQIVYWTSKIMYVFDQCNFEFEWVKFYLNWIWILRLKFAKKNDRFNFLSN